ncbi:MAG: hypothetical protein P8Y04_14070 [Desulfobulbaceae bacterium]
MDMRFLTVPYMNIEKKMAFATGLELFLDTASEDALGSGAWSLGPQVFFVKFLSRGLFAPGLQWKVSVDEDSGRAPVNQILIDLNYLFMAKDKLSWFFTDPQVKVFTYVHRLVSEMIDQQIIPSKLDTSSFGSLAFCKIS